MVEISYNNLFWFLIYGIGLQIQRCNTPTFDPSTKYFPKLSMSLSNQDIKHIAKLSAIELSDEELTRYEADLNSLFTLFENLKGIDTEGVEPLTHPISLVEEVALRLRDDIVTEVDTIEHREALMSNAPASTDGVFLVPKVIE